jgi:hypothetical protein
MLPGIPPASPYEQGVAHLKRGEHEKAVAAFTEAIRLNPKEAKAYSGRALAHRSLEDEAAALRDEQTVRELGGVKPPAGELLMLLTPDHHIHQRMSNPDQFVSYVKAVVDATESYFRRVGPPCGLLVRVACAVLPHDKLLLEIEVRPREQAEAVAAGLRKDIEAIARPKVSGGPVAFASQSVVQGGCSEEQGGFGAPFATFFKPGQQGLLDDLLLSAAGEAAEPTSWWGKLKRFFG